MDMSVYGLSGGTLREVMKENIVAAKGVQHYGMGILGNTEDSSMADEFAASAQLGIVNMYTWPNIPEAELSPQFWELSRRWLQGSL